MNTPKTSALIEKKIEDNLQLRINLKSREKISHQTNLEKFGFSNSNQKKVLSKKKEKNTQADNCTNKLEQYGFSFQ